MSEINNDRRFRISIRNVLQRVGFLGKAGFRRVRRGTVVAGIVLLGSVFAAVVAAKGEQISFLSFIYNGVFFPNPNGASQTYSTNGVVSILKDHSFKAWERMAAPAVRVISPAMGCRCRLPACSAGFS